MLQYDSEARLNSTWELLSRNLFPYQVILATLQAEEELTISCLCYLDDFSAGQVPRRLPRSSIWFRQAQLVGFQARAARASREVLRDKRGEAYACARRSELRFPAAEGGRQASGSVYCNCAHTKPYCGLRFSEGAVPEARLQSCETC